MNRLTASSALATAMILVACGGGTESPDNAAPQPPPAQTTAEGIWTGNSPVADTKGLDASLVVLENGEAWGIFGLETPVSTLHGALSSADGKISGSNAPGTAGGSYSGTYTPRANMDARLGGANFVGSYVSSYEKPASLSAFTGSHWVTGKVGVSSPWFVSLDDSGVLRIVTALHCEGSGSLKPRASGKGVFDLSVSFTGQGCASVGPGWGDSPSMSGVAWQDGKRLIVMGLKAQAEPVSQNKSGFAFTVNPSETAPAPTPTPLPPAEPLPNPTGLWTGTLATGRTLTLLVLEDGDTWGFYRDPGTSLPGNSVLRGATSWADGKLSGSGEEADILSGSYSGTYTPDGRMQMQFQEGAFSGRYSSAIDQPPTLAAIAGHYRNSFLGITISESGDMTLGTFGCAGKGKATPRSGGKNVFDVHLDMGPCYGNLRYTGARSGVMYYENGTLAILAQGAQIGRMVLVATKSN